MNYVTFENLFSYSSVIIGVIMIFITIYTYKKN